MALPPIEFRIDRAAEPDGIVRLSVSGEIDIATAGRLQAELEALRAGGAPVRLDLSQTGFIDSSGLAVLIAAKQLAEADGWAFEIDPQLAPAVQRLFALAGIESFFWR